MAIKRIQTFLLNDEMTQRNASIECDRMHRNVLPKGDTVAIRLVDITSKWLAGSNRNAGIYNSSLSVASGELCAVIGAVGSGLLNFWRFC